MDELNFDEYSGFKLKMPANMTTTITKIWYKRTTEIIKIEIQKVLLNSMHHYKSKNDNKVI